MDNDEIVDELSIFGLTFENDNVVNALNLFMKRNECSTTDTLDALVAYATNKKQSNLTQSFVNEFIDSESSNAVQRQENIPPTKMETFSPVKKGPTFSVDDGFISSTSVVPFKVTQRVKGVINVKLVLDESFQEDRFSLLPYSLTCNDDVEDVLEILSTGDDVTVSGCIFVPKRNNELEKVRIMSKKYGNLEIDLSKVSQEFIFDKMFATFDANFEGNVLKVRNLISPVPPKPAELFRGSLKLLKDFASIMVACGPFTDENSFSRIFNHAKENSVKLLIIFGPLPCLEKSGIETVDRAFDKILHIISELAEGDMDVVIVPPNENDPFILYPTYPTTAYQHTDRYTPEVLKSKKVHLLDNPSVFSFDGMQIAVANFDTMKALSKGTLVTAAELPTSDRMIWYVQQMIQYGQICPSYSCPSTMKNNKFVTSPTIFVSPSKLRSFAAGIENVFYVNLCSNRGNGYSIIKPKVVDTNEEEIKLEFDTSFYV
uniref:DNA polymerase alpha subunit B n=1 Tax=Panagrolaimus sp. ES5 TaxID=591445 RepID=A0AC34GVW5_9BILA